MKINLMTLHSLGLLIGILQHCYQLGLPPISGPRGHYDSRCGILGSSHAWLPGALWLS